MIEVIDIKNSSGIQSISLPADFKIDDDKVYLKKVGNIIYVIPYHSPLQNLRESIHEFTDDFMEQRIQPTEQKREFFD